MDRQINSKRPCQFMIEEYFLIYKNASIEERKEIIETMPDYIYYSLLMSNLKKTCEDYTSHLKDKDVLKYFNEDEIKEVFMKNFTKTEKDLNKLIKDINADENRLKQFKLDVLNEKMPGKTKKKSIKPCKFNQNSASCFTDKLSVNIIKEHKSKQLENDTNDTKIIITENINTDFGNMHLEAIFKGHDTSYILKNYRTIRFSREELQIYLAILNVYMQNTLKKDYGKPFEFSTKDFHNNILSRKNRLRKTDLQKYENIFVRIASKRVAFSSKNATIDPFNQFDSRINSTLVNIDIISSNDYKDQIIRIVPSALTLLELNQVKQISNFFPVDFLKLPFKKSDNILYFALYLSMLHRNNEWHYSKEKGKRRKKIYNKGFKKELFIMTIINNALPNYQEVFKSFEEYKSKNNDGKKYFDREILNPLKETISIYVEHGYINKNYKMPEYSKNILNEKLTVIFNYDVGKLIETDKFKKDEKK